MAISAPTQSTQYVDYVAGNKVAGYDWGAKVRHNFFSLTFTAAGFTSADALDIFLVKLPAGLIRVLTPLSWIYCPIGTATADLDIGWAAYVDNTGATIAADGDGFADSLDVGGAAIDQTLPLPSVGRIKEFNSRNGVVIACSFDTANSPGAGVMNGWIAYQLVG